MLDPKDICKYDLFDLSRTPASHLPRVHYWTSELNTSKSNQGRQKVIACGLHIRFAIFVSDRRQGSSSSLLIYIQHLWINLKRWPNNNADNFYMLSTSVAYNLYCATLIAGRYKIQLVIEGIFQDRPLDFIAFVPGIERGEIKGRHYRLGQTMFI